MVGESFSEPLVATFPVQLPDAVQLVAFTDDQESVLALPTVIDGADKVSVGATGGASTASVTALTGEAPIALAQVSE